jgi:hypothetical protein
MVILSKQQGLLLSCLLASKPVSLTQIVSELYDGRADGGPLDAQGSIHVQIYKLRRMLRPLGIHILSIGHSNSFAGYIVDPDHQQQAAELITETSVQLLKRAREREKSYAVNQEVSAG